jgi:hypothetical protein
MNQTILNIALWDEVHTEDSTQDTPIHKLAVYIPEQIQTYNDQDSMVFRMNSQSPDPEGEIGGGAKRADGATGGDN